MASRCLEQLDGALVRTGVTGAKKSPLVGAVSGVDVMILMFFASSCKTDKFIKTILQ